MPVVVPSVSVVVVSPRSTIFALVFADERYGSPLLVISSCVEAEYVGWLRASSFGGTPSVTLYVA